MFQMEKIAWTKALWQDDVFEEPRGGLCGSTGDGRGT